MEQKDRGKVNRQTLYSFFIFVLQYFLFFVNERFYKARLFYRGYIKGKIEMLREGLSFQINSPSSKLRMHAKAPLESTFKEVNMF